jgi:hypothetical protein
MYGRFIICIAILCALFLAQVSSATVRVSSINDFSFGSWSGSGDLTAEDDICVYNSVDGNYRVTITATGGAYQMTSSGNLLDFTVRFKKNGGSYSQLTHGVPSSFDGANTSSTICSGGTNATIEVQITSVELLSVRPGSYSGALTILIEPE